MAQCVECGGEVPSPNNPIVGEILACPHCGVELEVTALEPLTLAMAPEIEEDWGE